MTPRAERLPANAEHAAPEPWPEVAQRLTAGRTYWLASTSGAGRPHVRPVLAVVLDDVPYFVANADSRKARNLVRAADAALSTELEDAHVVVEGAVSVVRDHQLLQRIADAYVTKYDWHPRVHNGAFDADYGAPTAGAPPYQVYALHPSAVYAFGVTERFSPTRYRFARG